MPQIDTISKPVKSVPSRLGPSTLRASEGWPFARSPTSSTAPPRPKPCANWPVCYPNWRRRANWLRGGNWRGPLTGNAPTHVGGNWSSSRAGRCLATPSVTGWVAPPQGPRLGGGSPRLAPASPL
jgi:hypothetical protein